MNRSNFTKIALYLTRPLVLIVIVLLLLLRFQDNFLKSGIISAIRPGISDQLVQDAIHYGGVAAVVLIILGVGLEARHSQKKSRIQAAPETKGAVQGASSWKANFDADSVILVHGTFAGPKPGVVQWYQPGSDFCCALDRELELRGVNARCWSNLSNPNDYFHWGPGDNTWIARSEAAQSLRAFLQQNPCTYHIIAHSHGGNVVLEALDWKGDQPADWFSGTVTLLGTPILTTNRRETSYIPVLWVLLLLGVSAGVYQTQSLYAYHALIPIAIFLALLVVRGLHQFSMFGDNFAIRFLEPEPTLLFISSKHDEAYRLLSGVLSSPNPLQDATNSQPIKATIREFWTVAKGSCRPRKRHVNWFVIGSLVLLSLATIDLAIGRFMPPIVAYWVVVATMAWLVLLSLISDSAVDGLSYLYHVVNASVVFVWELLCYPFMLAATAIGKKKGWSLFQAYVLGLVNSPMKPEQVTVKMSPDKTKHEFHELPHDLVAPIVKARNKSAHRELARFIDNLSSVSNDWSYEGVKGYFKELNEPGIVHSCYYSLDHQWPIETMAAHIERYRQTEEKEAKDFETSMMEELNYGRDD